jgi:hypothetical protein
MNRHERRVAAAKARSGIAGSERRSPTSPDLHLVAHGDVDVFMASGPDVSNESGAIMIGDKGHLTERDARLAADAWNAMVRRGVKSIYVFVDGYEDDARPLWDVTEVAAYIRLWAGYVGLKEWGEAARGPLHPDCLPLLALCGVFGSIRPPIIIDRPSDN